MFRFHFLFFKNFSSLVFSNLDMIGRDVAFWCLFYLEFSELPGSLVCFLPLIFWISGPLLIQMFLFLFSLLFCQYHNYAHITHVESVLCFLDVIFFSPLSFCSLHFSLLSICQPTFKLTDSLVISFQSINESIKGVFGLLPFFKISSVFFQLFLRISTSFLHWPSVLIYSVLFELLTY